MQFRVTQTRFGHSNIMKRIIAIDNTAGDIWYLRIFARASIHGLNIIQRGCLRSPAGRRVFGARREARKITSLTSKTLERTAQQKTTRRDFYSARVFLRKEARSRVLCRNIGMFASTPRYATSLVLCCVTLRCIVVRRSTGERFDENYRAGVIFFRSRPGSCFNMQRDTLT